MFANLSSERIDIQITEKCCFLKLKVSAFTFEKKIGLSVGGGILSHVGALSLANYQSTLLI